MVNVLRHVRDKLVTTGMAIARVDYTLTARIYKVFDFERRVVVAACVSKFREKFCWFYSC